MSKFRLSARQLDETEPWKKNIVTPRVAAVGVVESPDKEHLLIIKRKYPPYGLAWPGGMIELGETITETAVREVFEETGIKAEPEGLLYLSSNPLSDPRWHVVVAYLIMNTRSFQTPEAGDDAEKAFWMPLKYDSKYIPKMVASSIEILNVYKKWRENKYKLLDIE